MYASPGRRLFAFVLDFLFLTVVLTLIAPLFGVSLGDVGENELPAAYRLTSLAIGASYQIFFVKLRGQTFGKMIARIKVVDDDSGRLTNWSNATIRWLIPGAAGFNSGLAIFAWPVIYGWLLFDVKRQGIHDKVARTVVIDLLLPGPDTEAALDDDEHGEPGNVDPFLR